MDTNVPRTIVSVAVLVGVILAFLLLWHVGSRRITVGDDSLKLVAAVTGATPEKWFGMVLQPVTPMLRKQLGVPRSGAIVSDVLPGGPAEAAGIQVGDVIRKLQDKTIAKPADVVSAFGELDPKEMVKVALWRQGQELTAQMQVGARPALPAQPPAALPEAEVEIEAAWLGLDIVPLSPAEAKEQDLGEDVHGMLVDDVAAGRGVDAGLMAGDVILTVNGKAARTISEFRQATREAVGALLDVLRGGRHIYISIAPPGTTPAERKLMQKRVGLTPVNWDGWTAWPATGLPPAYATAQTTNREPRAWSPPVREDWRMAPVREDWRQMVVPEMQMPGGERGIWNPAIGAFAVGR